MRLLSQAKDAGHLNLALQQTAEVSDGGRNLIVHLVNPSVLRAAELDVHNRSPEDIMATKLKMKKKKSATKNQLYVL